MFDHFRETRERWGWWRAIYQKLMTVLERRAGLHLFIIQSRLLEEDPPVADLPDGDEVRVMQAQEVADIAQDSGLGIPAEFLRGAADRGDMCVGYLEHGALVSYGWLGRGDSPMEAGLNVRVGREYIYGYKSFTLPSHRGRRLQQAIIYECDRWLTAHGYRYNIDYIRTHNFASISADRRYGNAVVGRAGYVRWFGRTWAFRSTGARRAGFQFIPAT